MACEHKYAFQGVVYWEGRFQLPGSGAFPRVYGDKYFCEKCLDTKILNEREHGNTYQKPIEGSFPR